jgi:dolichol kinase
MSAPAAQPALSASVPVSVPVPAPVSAAATLAMEHLRRSAARPTNVIRTGFHIASGLLALAMIRYLPSRAWLVAGAGAIALVAWSMEAARRLSGPTNERLMRFFARIAHAEERHRVNSSTWYVTALTILAALASPRAAALGVAVLAIGDPAAGVVGRSIGRVPLRPGRSLEGTLGFVTFGGLAALGWLAFEGTLSMPARLILAGSCAVAGALAELASTRMDDNFTIPLVCASVATVVEWVMRLG